MVDVRDKNITTQRAEAGDTREETARTLHAMYAPVRAELDEVEQILRKELSSNYPLVDRLVKHGFRLGGKRMRPALVLLSARACGGLSPDHVLLAAAVEMIHTATLIHDDVLDEAALRRHLDTVNARWDNEASILLGDYLFARALCMASTLDSTFACRAIGEATKVMCEGELRQVVGRGHFELSEEDYLDIITDKTAALCACCCRLGAHHAGAEDQRRDAFTRFGRYLGVAFQITDDLLDVLGDEAATGKSLGTDLAKQKPTLPLIRLLDGLNPKQRTEVLAILSCEDDHRREALRPWLARTDAIDYARRKAAAYIRRAIDELDKLDGIDLTPSLDSLRQLANFVVTRRQ